MMFKKHCIRIISIVSLLVLIFVQSVFADEYEYNDVNIYLGGQYQKSVALTSDNWIPSYGYMEVDTSQSTLRIRFQGGSWIDTLVNISNYTIDTVTCTQSGGYKTGMYVSGYLRFNDIVTANFPEVNLYVNIQGGSSNPVKLETPVVTVDTNLLSWYRINHATGYTIRFATDRNGSDNRIIENNYQGNVYDITETGYYAVSANGDNTYQNSDYSGYLYAEYVENENTDGTILDFFNRVIEGLNNAFASISSFLHNIGDIFDGLFAFMPVEVRSVFWAVIVVGLVMSLFMK